MAGTIIDNTRLQLTHGTLAMDFNPGKITISQTTQLVFDRVCVITTSETTVAITGATSGRVLILYNLDTTNFVNYGFIGVATTPYPLRLYPASIPHKMELNTTITNIYLDADVASCKVRIICLEL